MKPYVEMDGPELVRVFNEIAASEAAKQLGIKPVERFRDRASGIKRILLLEKSIKEGNDQPKSTPQEKSSVEKILAEEFRARPGTNRWKMLNVLVKNQNSQVPISKLIKAVYNSDDDKMKGALNRVWDGAKDMIIKWKLNYEAREEKDATKSKTYGLHKTNT